MYNHVGSIGRHYTLPAFVTVTRLLFVKFTYCNVLYNALVGFWQCYV